MKTSVSLLCILLISSFLSSAQAACDQLEQEKFSQTKPISSPKGRLTDQEIEKKAKVRKTIAALKKNGFWEPYKQANFILENISDPFLRGFITRIEAHYLIDDN